MLEGAEPPVDLVHTTEFLRSMPAAELAEAPRLLVQHFGGVDLEARRGRIALIGLRGAGKSTLGAMLADRMEVPFVELDRLIEQESGVSLSAIFDLYGQGGFRRLERRCLDQVIERYPRFVLWPTGAAAWFPSRRPSSACLPSATPCGCALRPRNTWSGDASPRATCAPWPTTASRCRI